MDSQELVERGAAKFGQEDFQGAIEDLTLALEEGERADAYVGRGLAYLGAGDPDEAREDLEHAVELEPECGAYHANLALVLRQLGEQEDCVEHCNLAESLGETDHLVYFIRGHALLTLGQHESAVLDLSRALEFEGDADTYASRAEALLLQGNAALAEADCSQALSLKPDHVRALSKRALARRQLGNEEAANADHQRAIELTIAELRRKLGDEDPGERAEALEELAELAMLPEYPDVLPTIRQALQDPLGQVQVCAAMALLEAGQAEEALQHLTALIGDPDLPTRATAAEALGDIAEDHPQALALLREASQDDSGIVRLRAAFALGEVDPSYDPLPPIKRELSDPEPLVRVEALKALAALPEGEAEADAAFQLAMEDPSDEVRAYAQLAAMMREYSTDDDEEEEEEDEGQS